MSNIAVHRLHSQQLEHTCLEKPGEVVRYLGVVQVQDYAGTKWSIGLRSPDSTDAGVEREIADNAFVRTWAMRGTLHFVTAPDVRWLLALVAPRIIAHNTRRYSERELDERTLARINAVLADTLRGGERLDRRSLLAILEENGISTRGQRAAYMLQRASLDGLICQSAVRRSNSTYMTLDEALPEAGTMEHGEAVAELARRYFTSRGPATLQDFVWWSGLSTADARAGLEEIKPQLVQETLEGRTYWSSPWIPEGGSSTVYLLTGFEEYLPSYRDRGASLDPVHAKSLSSGDGVLSPTIVADGRVVGTWKRTFKKDSVILTVTPFAPLSEARNRALNAAVEHYCWFVGMPATVVT